MTKIQDKRVYAGYYQRYDGQIIYVVMVIKDADTDADIVIFQPFHLGALGEYKVMSKRSFCELVTVNEEEVPKFKRRTQHPIQPSMDDYQREHDLRGPIRYASADEKDVEIRHYRRCHSYMEYSKDVICHYGEDIRKYELCVRTKKYVGVLPAEFRFLKEDLKFLQDCTSTVLKEYKTLLDDKFYRQLSVRKYAELAGINRGSVDYMQKKLFLAFAEQLRIRDEADQKRRLI